MSTPIWDFEEKDADVSLGDCLKKWQHLLFLDGWNISVEVTDDVLSEENFMVGINRFDMMNKVSYIRILSRRAYYEQTCSAPWVRQNWYCAELTLVHELLHLKYNWLVLSDTTEGHFMDQMLHNRLEEMARTLVAARYGLDP